MTTYQQKITFGEMRESGVRDVLIYCRDYRCSHHVEINADDLALRHRTELHLYAYSPAPTMMAPATMPRP